MDNPKWIGMDLGKEEFYAAIAGPADDPEDWARLPVARFDNSRTGILQLLRWVAAQGLERAEVAGVCLEATGRLSWTFAQNLGDRLGPVSIVNPAYPVAHGRSLGIRHKTDRTAACVLALFGCSRKPKPRPLPTVAQRKLRELSDLYDTFLKERKAHLNRLQEPIAAPAVRRMLKRQIRALQREMQLLEKEMDRLIEECPLRKKAAKRIKTIPGVGPKTARAILAHFGDLGGYRRNELVSLAGLYPRMYESGTSVHRKPRLVKGGGARVRAALYMAALSARQFCPHLRLLADRLRARGMCAKAILGVLMRKLLLLMRALVVSDKDYCEDFTCAQAPA